MIPTVLRVIDVPASATLPELHELLQAALGWTDSHLHQFLVGPRCYGAPHKDSFEDEHDETTVALTRLPDRFVYVYDLGDHWEHDVQILGPGGDCPGCVYGEGDCPPEDCGGPHGFTDMLAALADPSNEEHRSTRERAGALPEFDQPATDTLLRQTVGDVPPSVRLLLELTRDGVTLTPGGRLPRTLVRQVQQQRPHWFAGDSTKLATIEDNLLPLTALHSLLREAGLLRLRKGVLAPTRAASEDLHVVRRLRSWLAQDEFSALVLDLTVATVATREQLELASLAASVFAQMGRGWATLDGDPITEQHVQQTISRYNAVARGLDLIDTQRGIWGPGPSALWLLPRATARAQLWSRTQAQSTCPQPPPTSSPGWRAQTPHDAIGQ